MYQVELLSTPDLLAFVRETEAAESWQLYDTARLLVFVEHLRRKAQSFDGWRNPIKREACKELIQRILRGRPELGARWDKEQKLWQVKEG